MASDAPPSYAQATGSSARSHRARNGIPPERRRSMEDEHRPLPEGWVRSFDPTTLHQFFVDTTADPPRSVWHHPYDDDEYLATLAPEERERVQALTRHPSAADIAAESTDDEDGDHHHHGHHSKTHAKVEQDSAAARNAAASSSGIPPPRPRPQRPASTDTKPASYGRKLKDKLTGTTHEQREREREARAQAEEEAYRRHLALRQAMATAERTGQPQFIGKDRSGREIFIEPSYGARGGYANNGQYVNPYAQGPYANPNARFISPAGSYSRPYGYGYGGGYGLPLAGGLLGGALLGGILF